MGPGLYATTPEQLPRRPFFPGLVNCIQVRNELLLAPNRQGESYIPAAAAVERGKAGGRSRSQDARLNDMEKGCRGRNSKGPFVSARGASWSRKPHERSPQHCLMMSLATYHCPTSGEFRHAPHGSPVPPAGSYHVLAAGMFHKPHGFMDSPQLPVSHRTFFWSFSLPTAAWTVLKVRDRKVTPDC